MLNLFREDKTLKREDASRSLRSCCSGRAARPRPRRPTRATQARLALESLLTLGTDLARSACVTMNTEAMLAVCTGLPSYARWPLLTDGPCRPLRAYSTTLPLDASKTSRARQACITLRPYERLDDDLNRARGQACHTRSPRLPLHALGARWACFMAVSSLLDADIGNASSEDRYQ